MSDDMFDPPGSGDKFDFKAHNGCLLMIKPLAERLQVPTKDYGLKDAIEADIHVLDGPDAGQAFRNAYVFPMVLQGQIKGGIGTGRFSLGRLGQGVATKGNPPWQLADPTEADYALARRYAASDTYKKNSGQPVVTPAQQQPQPVQQPVPQVAPTQQAAQPDPWGAAGQQPAQADPWASSEPPF